MNDIVQQMQGGMTLVQQAVAEMRAAGMHEATIAAVLFAEAGFLWREAFPVEADRRMVVSQAAEVAITGMSQPLPHQPR